MHLSSAPIVSRPSGQQEARQLKLIYAGISLVHIALIALHCIQDRLVLYPCHLKSQHACCHRSIVGETLVCGLDISAGARSSWLLRSGP
jgi:hypothetical protein